MALAYLNQIGLILGVVGVVLIFIWGPPQPNMEQGVGLGLEDANRLGEGRTVAEHNADVRKLRKRHGVLSKVGLFLVGLGFLCQFLAQSRPSRTVETEQLILRDAQGRARLTMGTSRISGVAIDVAPDEPTVWLTDTKGTDRAILTGDGLRFADEKGRPLQRYVALPGRSAP